MAGRLKHENEKNGTKTRIFRTKTRNFGFDVDGLITEKKKPDYEKNIRKIRTLEFFSNVNESARSKRSCRKLLKCVAEK